MVSIFDFPNNKQARKPRQHDDNDD